METRVLDPKGIGNIAEEVVRGGRSLVGPGASWEEARSRHKRLQTEHRAKSQSIWPQLPLHHITAL